MRQAPERLYIDALAWWQHGVELSAHVTQIVWVLEQENQSPTGLGCSRFIARKHQRQNKAHNERVRPRATIGMAGLDEGLQKIVVGLRVGTAFGEQRPEHGIQLPFGAIATAKFGQRKIWRKEEIQTSHQVT